MMENYLTSTLSVHYEDRASILALRNQLSGFSVRDRVSGDSVILSVSIDADIRDSSALLNLLEDIMIRIRPEDGKCFLRFSVSMVVDQFCFRIGKDMLEFLNKHKIEVDFDFYK